jgi:hypothetical protein
MTGHTSTTVRRLADGKVGRIRYKPEDLPESFIIQSFRVKGMECKMSSNGRQFIFLLYFIFSEGSFN